MALWASSWWAESAKAPAERKERCFHRAVEAGKSLRQSSINHVCQTATE